MTTEWILITTMAVSILFADGSTVHEETTLESKPFESLENCERSGMVWKINTYGKNHRHAAQYGATITEEKYDHNCINAEAH